MAAAAAVAETVALRALAEPGSLPGGPSQLRTPAEPSPALARRGSLQPGKHAGSSARAGRAWARGALSARGARYPAQLRRPSGPSAPAPARRALSRVAHGRGALGPGVPAGTAVQGGGERAAGPRDGLFTNTAGPGGGRRRAPGNPLLGVAQVLGARFSDRGCVWEVGCEGGGVKSLLLPLGLALVGLGSRGASDFFCVPPRSVSAGDIQVRGGGDGGWDALSLP